MNSGISELCSICLESLNDSSEIGAIGCNHQFHFQCIRDWSKCENSCPVCKGTFRTIDKQCQDPVKKARKSTIKVKPKKQKNTHNFLRYDDIVSPATLAQLSRMSEEEIAEFAHITALRLSQRYLTTSSNNSNSRINLPRNQLGSYHRDERQPMPNSNSCIDLTSDDNSDSECVLLYHKNANVPKRVVEFSS